VVRGSVAISRECLGQVASDASDVQDDQVRLEQALACLLARLANKIQPAIRASGALMLEEKK
jgi:hypothetical protein